jgi:hypothetical protein
MQKLLTAAEQQRYLDQPGFKLTHAADLNALSAGFISVG